jgi:hypothetical protein
MNKVKRYLSNQTSIAPLVTLRVLFGFIMAASIVRFVARGWVYDLYIKPKFFFSYYGFEWIRPLSGEAMYVIFAIMLVAALGIMLGYFYRVSAIIFFLIFTYVELIDKTNYLNHYYFVSLVSFLLIWVPANASFSLDAAMGRTSQNETVPQWTVFIFKLQLAFVYIFAGIAKINEPWLLEALPLKIWLPANNHLPIVGPLLTKVWVAYLFSWGGCIYDLFIVFFLINARTRVWAYGAVVGFHLVTWFLFPIGMFPFIMILATLIFFSDSFHASVIKKIQSVLPSLQRYQVEYAGTFRTSRIATSLLIAFFVLQVILPWRYLLYPGNLFWTEQGYRFSWRVMLMEKAGYVTYHVADPGSDRKGDVMPSDYLTPVQVKMMATQPDMIVQFAHFLENEFKKQGIADPVITAHAYVTLNGNGSRLYIDPTVDLTTVEDSFRHKDWITALKD